MPQWCQSHLKPLYPQSAAKQKRNQPSPHNCPCALRTIKNFTNKIMEVIMQAVAGGYQKSFQKPNTYQKSTNPFVPSQQKPPASQNTNPFGKPYLGPPREPQVTPSADGSLNPALSCKYCKDTGHDVSNCAKVKRKRLSKLPLPLNSQTSPKRKTRQTGVKGSWFRPPQNLWSQTVSQFCHGCG